MNDVSASEHGNVTHPIEDVASYDCLYSEIQTIFDQIMGSNDSVPHDLSVSMAGDQQSLDHPSPVSFASKSDVYYACFLFTPLIAFFTLSLRKVLSHA